MDLLAIFILAYMQNISFCIVSRARNRNSYAYHAVAAVLSNAVWFATFKLLVTADMSWMLFAPYTAGTVLGSLTGAWVSTRIERLIGATT